MAPGNPHVTSQLRQLIYYHLDCNLLRNALFLAGRLQAHESKSTEAAYLLALCHLRLGQLKAAYDSSRNAGSRGTHLGCSYVFAQACLGLERYVEGVTALDRSKGLWSSRNSWGKHTDTRRQHLPDASAILCLQGKLWRGHSDTTRAIECYAESLKLNPFMWDAFLDLCDLGVNVRTPNIFKMTPEMMSQVSTSIPEETSLGTLDESPPSNALSQTQVNVNTVPQQTSTNDPFSISKNRVNSDIRTGNMALFERLNGKKTNVVPPVDIVRADPHIFETPTGPPPDADDSILAGKGAAPRPAAAALTNDLPLAPVKRSRTILGSDSDSHTGPPPKMGANPAVRSKSRSREESGEQANATQARSSNANHSSGDLKRTVSGKAPPSQTTSLVVKADSTTTANDPGAPQRRSMRLFNTKSLGGKLGASTGSIGTKEGRELKKAKTTTTKARSANSFNVGRVVSGNRKHGEPMEIDGKEQRPVSHSTTNPAPPPKPAVNEKVKEYEALQWLLDLFTKLGSGYFALSNYQCNDALRIYNSIIPSQRDTPWVLAQIGRAYYEQGSYSEACKTFTRIKTLAPSRLEDMEVYSTTLWHLKNDIDLAFLAHTIIDSDRNSPQAWCAVGNSFSLQRDHDQALKCFNRATQLDPKFAYAYTLQGHEHVANEEYDKALSSYRASISAENRHYNAWYGLGKVYEKQGKYKEAEDHYRTAAKINPTNAVLICCIGQALEKLKNPRAALVQYTKACGLSEKSAMCRFRKANVLMVLREFEKALSELKLLKDIAPDEANVHFLLGRCCKVLRDKGMAIRHFTMALNLDPKASHYIKEAMEQMEDEDDEDEDAEM